MNIFLGNNKSYDYIPEEFILAEGVYFDKPKKIIAKIYFKGSIFFSEAEFSDDKHFKIIWNTFIPGVYRVEIIGDASKKFYPNSIDVNISIEFLKSDDLNITARYNEPFKLFKLIDSEITVSVFCNHIPLKVESCDNIIMVTADKYIPCSTCLIVLTGRNLEVKKKFDLHIISSLRIESNDKHNLIVSSYTGRPYFNGIPLKHIYGFNYILDIKSSGILRNNYDYFYLNKKYF